MSVALISNRRWNLRSDSGFLVSLRANKGTSVALEASCESQVAPGKFEEQFAFEIALFSESLLLKVCRDKGNYHRRLCNVSISKIIEVSKAIPNFSLVAYVLYVFAYFTGDWIASQILSVLFYNYGSRVYSEKYIDKFFQFLRFI